MLHVEQLRKTYGSLRAVDGISFDVAKGEVVGLLGPNGAGKTTAMRMITGYLRPDGGAVQVAGISVIENPLEARRHIGYLPENAPLYLDLEVTEYLHYIGSLRALPQEQRTHRVREMVERCGLTDVVGRQISQLSKGYRQRVGLAQAMMHHPSLLILDEPTSGLDPNQIVEIRNLIREIGKEQTIILSTHILQEVEATCHRAMIIHHGRLVGVGSIAELLHHGADRAHYIITARTTRQHLVDAFGAMHGIEVGEWLSLEGEERQRVTLHGTNGKDQSEAIFQTAVAHGFPLAELRREAVSLEQVFRELTGEGRGA